MAEIYLHFWQLMIENGPQNRWKLFSRSISKTVINSNIAAFRLTLYKFAWRECACGYACNIYVH